MAQEVFIVAGARTAIGSFGGSLKEVPPADLGATVIGEAIRRAELGAEDIEHVVMGQVIPTVPADAYLARVAAVRAGVPYGAPALTLNRLCGSGLQAVISAAQMIALGEVGLAVAGGAENMSRSPHLATTTRWGTKMGEVVLLDLMLGTLADPFDGAAMGVTGENVAERFGISREAQDALAAESHARAARAIAEGRFVDEIVPVEVKSRKGVTHFATDEHVRAETTIESLATLRPAFRRDGGSVTAGNASGINDGAAALVLASAEQVAARKLRPMAKILGWGHAGVDPQIMGIGPVHAVPIALRRAGLELGAIDVIEANEAFASQACAVARELGFDPAKLNPNGSGIALGHPIGATGAILVVKTLYELRRTGGRYGLITMCIGGGQGIAMVIERVETDA